MWVGFCTPGNIRCTTIDTRGRRVPPQFIALRFRINSTLSGPFREVSYTLVGWAHVVEECYPLANCNVCWIRKTPSIRGEGYDCPYTIPLVHCQFFRYKTDPLPSYTSFESRSTRLAFISTFFLSTAVWLEAPRSPECISQTGLSIVISSIPLWWKVY